jgi:hypothetical protein
VNFDSSLPPDAPAILIAADESDGVHWRVGYNNFYVITRYNHSALYAMAVYELAAAVKQRILLLDAAALGPAALSVASPAQVAGSAQVARPIEPAARDAASAASETRRVGSQP